MAGMTLAQSIDLTNDVLQAGVIETMATESKLIAVLPFMTIEGAGYAYNVETSLSDVQFRAVNTAYTPTLAETERKTEHLVILGGEAVIDSFQLEVHSNINDLMAVETALKAKSIVHKFEKTFLSGDAAKDSNAFDGLVKRVSTDKVFEATEDIVGDIDVLLDEVQGGADALIMNKKTRRELNKHARTSLTQYTNEFGIQVTQFGGVDIIDIEGDLLEDEAIFAVRFGVHEAVTGLQSKSGVNVTSLGQLGETPQVKTRIEWFVGMAVFNPNTVVYRKPAAPVGE